MGAKHPLGAMGVLYTHCTHGCKPGANGFSLENALKAPLEPENLPESPLGDLVATSSPRVVELFVPMVSQANFFCKRQKTNVSCNLTHLDLILSILNRRKHNFRKLFDKL